MIPATKTFSLMLAAMMLPAVASASTDAEWEKFAKDVEQKCTDATKATFRKSQVIVDPTGSENYGLAIVFGRSKQEKGPAAVICVYDKKTQKVEVGGEMGKDLVRIRKPKAEGDKSAAKNTTDSADSADDSDAGEE